MPSSEPERTARELLAIGRDAAALVLSGWRTALEVGHKGEIDLVTRFDLASEDLLRERLARSFPGCDLVAEEGGGTPSGTRPVLYADPLDGTTNFAHGHPFFCVTLALMEGPTVLAGAIVAPALGWEFLAAQGAGARRNAQPCRVSRVPSLGAALLATGFPYDQRKNPDNNLREFAELTLRSHGVRRCGSAALDLCLVGDGTYDAYWERRLHPWDLAAGALVVAEAGGTLSDFDGQPPDVRTGGVVASNGLLHAELLDALRQAPRRPPILPFGS